MARAPARLSARTRAWPVWACSLRTSSSRAATASARAFTVARSVSKSSGNSTCTAWAGLSTGRLLSSAVGSGSLLARAILSLIKAFSLRIFACSRFCLAAQWCPRMIMGLPWALPFPGGSDLAWTCGALRPWLAGLPPLGRRGSWFRGGESARCSSACQWSSRLALSWRWSTADGKPSAARSEDPSRARIGTQPSTTPWSMARTSATRTTASPKRRPPVDGAFCASYTAITSSLPAGNSHRGRATAGSRVHSLTWLRTDVTSCPGEGRVRAKRPGLWAGAPEEPTTTDG
mmetsp:Transcript_17684/g.51694  ORF Transcript_17684/g.51694 Transcript_17684/m.51694 type:complete len:289 (-) Transcript_17684:1090-1956(-)